MFSRKTLLITLFACLLGLALSASCTEEISKLSSKCACDNVSTGVCDCSSSCQSQVDTIYEECDGVALGGEDWDTAKNTQIKPMVEEYGCSPAAGVHQFPLTIALTAALAAVFAVRA